MSTSSKPSEAGGYPPRPSHFAHRVTRLLFKSCACQDVGHHAVLLVAHIAHTEDAARYQGPVRFWNSQLMETLGFKSPKQLSDARRRAIEAGWLHYDRGGTREVGRYWTDIPPSVQKFDDRPIEESVAIRSASGTNQAEILSANGTNQEAIHSAGGTCCGMNCGKLSYPIPNPNASCAEQGSAPAAGGRSEFEFPTKGKGGRLWTLTRAKLHEYLDAYPDLDVAAELRKARQWCLDNPRKQKTAGGMLTFLTNWLNRAQNQQGTSRAHGKQPPQPGESIYRELRPPA